MHQAVALYSRAVLAMQDDASLLQGDVQKTFATSAVSTRRYRALMARLPTEYCRRRYCIRKFRLRKPRSKHLRDFELCCSG